MHGLGLPPRANANSGVDGKMNGLHGPKRKGSDIMAWIGYVVLLSVSLRHLLISLPSQPIFRHAF